MCLEIERLGVKDAGLDQESGFNLDSVYKNSQVLGPGCGQFNDTMFHRIGFDRISNNEEWKILCVLQENQQKQFELYFDRSLFITL